MTPTPTLTAEQILVDEWIRQADRAKSMTGMDAIWFPDAEETLAALREHGLLSEGAPTETKWVCGKCSREQARGHDDGQIPEHHRTCPKRTEAKQPEDWSTEELDKVTLDRLQEVIDDAADEQDDLRLHMLVPQEPLALDPEKVAEVLLANAKSRYGGLLFEERTAARIAQALCEAYTEGKLT